MIEDLHAIRIINVLHKAATGSHEIEGCIHDEMSKWFAWDRMTWLEAVQCAQTREKGNV